MTTTIAIPAKEIIYRVSAAGYAESLAAGDDPRAPHLADIAEEGYALDRVLDSVSLAAALVSDAVSASGKEEAETGQERQKLTPQGEVVVRICTPAPLTRQAADAVSALVQDACVARALADFLSTFMPEKSAIWSQRFASCVDEARRACNRRTTLKTRRVSPI